MDSPVQQLVPPVVIISACGLLCLAQFGRYSGIIDRLRRFHRERFEAITRLPELDGAERELLADRCNHLEHQAHQVLELARLIRSALLMLVMAVICMIVSSLMIGLEQLWPVFGSHAAVTSFVIGLLFMLGGMIFVFAEVWRSLSVVGDEHRRLEVLEPGGTKQHKH